MDSYLTTKMSLLAQFDDLCRYNAGLTMGCEREFKMFVENQKKLLEKVRQLQGDKNKLLSEVNDLQAKTSRLDVELKHARSTLIAETNKNTKLQKEKSSLERQIALIKELLTTDEDHLDDQTKQKLVQLSSVHVQPNESISRLTTIEESCSSSDSDEMIDEFSSFKKNCKCGARNCCCSRSNDKRKSDRRISESADFEDVFSIHNGYEPRRNITFRCNSEPNTTLSEEPMRQKFRSDSEQIREHASDIRQHNLTQSRMSFPNSRCSTGGKLDKRHVFIPKFFIRSEKCHPCGKIIKFCKQALKCSECRINCHQECKKECSLPCIPIVRMPLKPSGTIEDFTSSAGPMIPPLIVHCINEIESRGLEDLGLYRVSGSERTVRELKEKFLKGKSVPSMNEIDVHAICGTIKEFLRSLSDSLIPKADWHTFTSAANHEDKNTALDLLYDAVRNLPQANRETMAFLILHLQRIASSAKCKMPISNISKAFGPTVVGYSQEDPNNSTMLKDIKQQTKIMDGLLYIPTHLWQSLLNIDTKSMSKTPEPLSVPVNSRLGPIYSGYKDKAFDAVERTNFEPRTARLESRSGRRQFLPSPMLK